MSAVLSSIIGTHHLANKYYICRRLSETTNHSTVQRCLPLTTNESHWIVTVIYYWRAEILCCVATVATTMISRQPTLLRAAALLLLLQVWSCHSGWIDPDTPLDKRTTKSFVDGTVYHLVCFYVHSFALSTFLHDLDGSGRHVLHCTALLWTSFLTIALVLDAHSSHIGCWITC